MASVTETLSSANDLLAAHSALAARVRQSQKTRRALLRTLPSPPPTLLNLALIPDAPPPPPASPPRTPPPPAHPRLVRQDLPPAKRARALRYANYVPEEETIRNDYSQRYVDGGEWPQDWVLGAEPERRFEEYPKQQRLLALKKASVLHWAAPPVYLPVSALHMLAPAKFDAILIDPPFSSSFTWDTLQDLPVPALAADPSFVFLWVGSGAGDGLERGREVLAKWGYRRCEDVTWLKTNTTTNRGPGTDAPTTSLLTRTKQHCLIGIRGTVRRSTDAWFVHCNVDTDVLLWAGDPADPTRKPPETHTLVENFCLGLRRLELFARAAGLRRGWVSALADGEEDKVPAAMAAAARGEPDFWGPAAPAPAAPPAVVAPSPLPSAPGLPLKPTAAAAAAPIAAGLPMKPAAPALTNGFGEDVSAAAAVRWDREAWEARLAEWCQGERAVVPATPEIDQLRPKSPVRGGGGGGGGGGPPPPGGMAQGPMAQGGMPPARPPPGMMPPGEMGMFGGGGGGGPQGMGPGAPMGMGMPMGGMPNQHGGMQGMNMGIGMGGGAGAGMGGSGGGAGMRVPPGGGRSMGPRGGMNPAFGGMAQGGMAQGFMQDGGGGGMMMGDGMGMGGMPGMNNMGGNMGGMGGMGNMGGGMGGAPMGGGMQGAGGGVGGGAGGMMGNMGNMGGGQGMGGGGPSMGAGPGMGAGGPGMMGAGVGGVGGGMNMGGPWGGAGF